MQVVSARGPCWCVSRAVPGRVGIGNRVLRTVPQTQQVQRSILAAGSQILVVICAQTERHGQQPLSRGTQGEPWRRILQTPHRCCNHADSQHGGGGGDTSTPYTRTLRPPSIAYRDPDAFHASSSMSSDARWMAGLQPDSGERRGRGRSHATLLQLCRARFVAGEQVPHDHVAVCGHRQRQFPRWVHCYRPHGASGQAQPHGCVCTAGRERAVGYLWPLSDLRHSQSFARQMQSLPSSPALSRCDCSWNASAVIVAAHPQCDVGHSMVPGRHYLGAASASRAPSASSGRTLYSPSRGQA